MFVMKHSSSIAVLDLAEITAMDAAGVGVLVSLHWWAKTTGARLKLMNLTSRVEDLLHLFNLRSVFKICSVPEMLSLLCLAFERSQSSLGERSRGNPGQRVDSELVLVHRAS
jgi:hypothetical protein